MFELMHVKSPPSPSARWNKIQARLTLLVSPSIRTPASGPHPPPKNGIAWDRTSRSTSIFGGVFRQNEEG